MAKTARRILDTLTHWIDGPQVQKCTTAIILLNSLAVALRTSTTLETHFGSLLEFVENFTILLFLVEVSIRGWSQRLAFFKGGWNIFDLGVIALSLIPHEAGFSVLRCFRVLKTLSMFETNRHVNNILSVIVNIWPRVFVTLCLMGLSFFILGVMGVELYGKDFPEYFGDLGWSMYTLFILMQSDGYGDLSKEIIEIYPLAWIYFVSVTVIMAFVMMNLFVGIVVDAMQGIVEDETLTHLKEDEDKDESEISQISTDLVGLKKDIKEIKMLLKKSS